MRLRAGGDRGAGGAGDHRRSGAHVAARHRGGAAAAEAAVHAEPHRADRRRRRSRRACAATRRRRATSRRRSPARSARPAGWSGSSCRPSCSAARPWPTRSTTIRRALESCGAEKVAIGSDMDGALKMLIDVEGFPALADALLRSGLCRKFGRRRDGRERRCAPAGRPARLEVQQEHRQSRGERGRELDGQDERWRCAARAGPS